MKQDRNKLYNLTVEEAYKLLCSKDMANNRCNIQIYKQTPVNPGGGNHNGRKPGSKNKMTLTKLAVTVNDLGIRLDQLAKIVQDGFKQINSRIDNLVIKNNLKE